MRAEHVVFAAATAGTVFGAITGHERLQQIAKPLIAPSLAVRVLRGRKGADPLDTALLAGGLVAATVGDVLLIDPDDDGRLVRGASSFAVMQASYAALLLRHRARPTAPAVVPRALAWLGAAGLLRSKAPTVAVPLAAYGISLGTATSLASDPGLVSGAKIVAGLVVPSSDPRSGLALGALLFTTSDGLIVFRRLFVRGEAGRRVAEGAILATYAAAQLLLVEGMRALARR